MLKTTVTALCLLLGLVAAHAQESTGPSAAVAPPAPEGDTLPAPIACSFEKVFVCEASGCAPSQELGTIDLPARFLIHFGEQIIASTSDDDLPHIELDPERDRGRRHADSRRQRQHVRLGH
ncbi:hypothetical protein ACFSKM_24940 [Ancylobacter dichloromethanicus]